MNTCRTTGVDCKTGKAKLKDILQKICCLNKNIIYQENWINLKSILFYFIKKKSVEYKEKNVMYINNISIINKEAKRDYIIL